MSEKSNGIGNGTGGGAPVPVSRGTKIGYIGTGVLIGLVIYPFVRKAVAKVQPKMDKVFDDLTGKAEDLAERASDLLARAKQNIIRSEPEESEKGHRHSHAHDHPEKPTKSRG